MFTQPISSTIADRAAQQEQIGWRDASGFDRCCSGTSPEARRVAVPLR